MALLWATLGTAPSPAHAATNATWNGQNILFDNHAYGKAGPEINKELGLPEGATVYSYIPQNLGGTNAASTDAFFIYFASGVDPPKATSADFFKFTLSNGKYTNERENQSITMTPQGDEDAVSSSCSVSGIGWIICPVSVWLAESMDWLFQQLIGFLEVKPLTLDVTPQNGLYTAWNAMRTIANIAFVIAFLIVIYTQLTGMGVTNYGMKKLIPRLIVAAILVNLSFYISAIAIDISNIIGASIHDVIQGIRRETFSITDDTAGAWGNIWTNITTLILGGGGVLFGVGFAVVTGAVFALVPMLMVLGITIFVVFVILAARQAIIMLLVVIAPLAFVANLLPNTEGLFSKWRKLFTTMLVFYPMFALVFSGAQLAGQIIVMNANGNIVTVLFGLAVQIAPLAITPLMFKLGGSLLSRIAQLVNNPNKGPIDKTRRWAERKAGLQRAKNGANRNGKTPWGALARRMDDSKANEEDSTKAYQTDADNRRHLQRKYGHIYEHQARADQDKKTIHNDHERHVETLKQAPGTPMHASALAAEVSDETLKGAQNRTNTMYNSMRSNPGNVLNASTVNLATSQANLDRSEQRKNQFLDETRSTRGNALHASTVLLEQAKLKADSAKNHQEQMITELKSVPGAALYRDARSNEASKEMVEVAQNSLKASLDRSRQTPGNELHSSSERLEESKIVAETAKTNYETMVTTNKTTPGTNLYNPAKRLEEVKVKLDTANQNYTAHVDTMKATIGTALQHQTVINQVAKDSAKTAQVNVEAMLDERRAVDGSDLNIAMIDMNNANLRAATNKSGAEATLKRAQNVKDSLEHELFMNSEKAKQNLQRDDVALQQTIEEYKSGKAANLTATEQAIADEMVTAAEEISAHNQGVARAKAMQVQHIADVMGDDSTTTTKGARGEALRDIAGSVDENGAQRAQAVALAEQSKANDDVRNTVKSIIDHKNFSNDEIRQLAERKPGDQAIKGIQPTKDAVAAALEMTLGGPDNAQVINALENVDFSFPGFSADEQEELRVLAADTLLKNPAKPPYITAGMMGAMKQGDRFDGEAFAGAYGKTGLKELVRASINNEKVDAGKLQSAGKDYSTSLRDSIFGNEKNRKPNKDLTPEAKDRLVSELSATLNGKNGAAPGLGDSKKTLEDMQEKLIMDGIRTGHYTSKVLKTLSESDAEGILDVLQKTSQTIPDDRKIALVDSIDTLIASDAVEEAVSSKFANIRALISDEE